jgi:hypothetical protein
MLRLSDIYYDNISPEEDDHLEQTASTDEDYFREKQALADQRVDGLEGPEVDEAISDIKMAQSEVESAVDILRTRSEGVDAFDGFIIERRLYPYSGISLGEFSSEVRSFLTEYNRLRRPILNVNESVGLGLENPEELATASMDDGIDDRSLH